MDEVNICRDCVYSRHTFVEEVHYGDNMIFCNKHSHYCGEHYCCKDFEDRLNG